MCEAPTKENGENTETSVMNLVITMCDVVYADCTIIVKYIEDMIHEYQYLPALLHHCSQIKLPTFQIQNCIIVYRCWQNEFGFCRYKNIKFSKKYRLHEQFVQRKNTTVVFFIKACRFQITSKGEFLVLFH